MSKLVDWGGDIIKGVGQATQSMIDGSKKIARGLGYGKVVPSLNPKIAPPLVVPMPDEQALQEAQRRRFAGQVTSGRASTVLTQQNDTLG
jgi:hypothetical protein